MYLFRFFILFALLNLDLTPETELSSNQRHLEFIELTTEGISLIDPCLLGSWRVDIETLGNLLDKPVTGSILITFETSPANEITASFDVTIPRRPPESATKRREHIGSLSATMEPMNPLGDHKQFRLTRVELDDSNSHKRYKADGDWRDITTSTEEYFLNATFRYTDCSPTMMIGMHAITLIRETY